MDASGQEEERFKELSAQGFYCIQSFFVLINSIQGKLLKIKEDHGVYVSRQAGPSASTGSPQTEEKKTSEENQDSKARPFTSYSSETGAGYTPYSFS